MSNFLKLKRRVLVLDRFSHSLTFERFSPIFPYPSTPSLCSRGFASESLRVIELSIILHRYSVARTRRDSIPSPPPSRHKCINVRNLLTGFTEESMFLIRTAKSAGSTTGAYRVWLIRSLFPLLSLQASPKVCLNDVIPIRFSFLRTLSSSKSDERNICKAKCDETLSAATKHRNVETSERIIFRVECASTINDCSQSIYHGHLSIIFFFFLFVKETNGRTEVKKRHLLNLLRTAARLCARRVSPSFLFFPRLGLRENW